MEKNQAREAELIYGLMDRPPWGASLFAALQHLLAIFVPIITPALIICGALGIDRKVTGEIVSMSLFVSGVATMIQIRRIGPLGSGLLSIQGTSFTFLGAIITAGHLAMADGRSPAEALGVIFGVCMVGSVIEMVISRFLRQARRLFPPLVSGVVVTLIGLTLIQSSMMNCAGGVGAEGFGRLAYLALAGFVLAIIVVLNRFSNRYLRMGSVVIGLMVGYVIAVVAGWVDFSSLKGLSLVAAPRPLKYGVGFEWYAFVPIALIYVVTAIESIGDITATSMVSGEPIEGDLYVKRISGGVLGDGFNSLLAGFFNTFPNTTFSQNNGIIQLTGVASRKVGYCVAGMLFLLGLSPWVAGFFALLPPPVLGGATLLMFGTVAAAGIKIIASQPLDRRALLILAVSLGAGIGVVMAPEALEHLPGYVRNVLNSGVVTGGLTALVCNLVLPPSR
jgi:xanthine permease XanP